MPHLVAMALQADGWVLRQTIIWHKPGPMPESVTDRCTKAHEYIFLLSKSARYWYDAEAVKEEVSENTNARISKKEIDRISSARSNGANTSVGHERLSAKVHDVDGMVKANASFENACCLPVTSRNRRSVWTVATQPFSGAHFATFPPKLIEPCILAGCPDQCCPACGMGWERVVEREAMEVRTSDKGQAKHDQGLRTSTSGTMVKPPTSHTLYHRPACNCREYEYDEGRIVAEHAPASVPGTVLDPFGGAATTGIVAHQLGRKAILCELSEEYCGLAGERLEKATDQGVLF